VVEDQTVETSKGRCQAVGGLQPGGAASQTDIVDRLVEVTSIMVVIAGTTLRGRNHREAWCKKKCITCSVTVLQKWIRLSAAVSSKNHSLNRYLEDPSKNLIPYIDFPYSSAL
jgi:hypothetical protein